MKTGNVVALVALAIILIGFAYMQGWLSGSLVTHYLYDNHNGKTCENGTGNDGTD